MAYTDNVMRIKHQLIYHLTDMILSDKLVENIDTIPLLISPRKRNARRRCCIYKERAVVKYKLLPLLGFEISDEVDELTPLSYYAQKALERQAPQEKYLTVVEEACTGCVATNYVVTNQCRGCVARPCSVNCPKDAIDFSKQGRAEIDEDKCVSCGICQKVCPYHSIIYVPIPCEASCPVKAITQNNEGVEVIDPEKCILCGRCITQCPFGSVYEISQIVDVLKTIKKGEKLIAMVAPSIMGQYKIPLAQVMSAIKALGFFDVVEVGEGADLTASHEAEELKEKIDAGEKFMTTSCCPGYTEYVKKHLPALQAYVSHTKTPAQFTADIIEERYPGCKQVFIGPCLAKRKESFENPKIAYTLTFEELDGMLGGAGIKIEKMPPIPLQNIKFGGRIFGQNNGVTGAVLAELSDPSFVKPLAINGIDKKSIQLLKAYAKEKINGNFVEVMACENGCIGGPCGHIHDSQGRTIYDKEIKAMYDKE